LAAKSVNIDVPIKKPIKRRKRFKTKIITLWRKHESLMFDLIKIGLIACIGSLWTQHWNVVSEARTAREEARKAAIQTADDITKLIGQRQYYALRATTGFQYKFSDAKQRFEQYDEIVKKWNEFRYSLLSLANRYFGDGTDKDIYKLIKSFDSIHHKIVAAKNSFEAKKTISDLKPCLDEIYKLDDDISGFSNGLQKQLKEGKVDSLAPNK
jgi:hypothetical protein